MSKDNCEYWKGSVQAQVMNAKCEEKAFHVLHDRQLCHEHYVEMKKRSSSY